MLDLNNLPSEVRDKLAELDLELSEGDITQKGYEKKKTKLLSPYINLHEKTIKDNYEKSQNSNKPNEQINNQKNQFQNINNNGVYAQAGSTSQNLLINNNVASPQTRAKRRVHRRVTRHESRYHSEVRQEAVQQALAAMKNKPKPALPMPSKRNSVLSRQSSKDSRNKYGNLRSRQRNSNRNHLHNLHSSSGHGTAGDSESNTDDDYDDDDDDDEIDDELMINESSGGTPEINLRKLTIGLNEPAVQHSSSEEVSSSASSSTHERLNSKISKKQNQPLPLPPRVIGVQESHSANNYDKNLNQESSNKNVNSQSNQQKNLFQLKDLNSSNSKPQSNNYHSSSFNNSPAKSNYSSQNNDDRPALPQHKNLQSIEKSSYSSKNQTQNIDRPLEKTPVRKHSKQTNSKNTSDLIDLNIESVPKSIEPFDSTNNISLQDLNKTNILSTNNSLENSAINLNNQLIMSQKPNNLDSLSLNENLPPEYDQVYDDHRFQRENSRNRSPSLRSHVSNQSYETNYSTGTGRYKVSAKIQQLLNTLKRPKKRPLHDFYKDYDCELEVQCTDPNAPKPEGSTMVPIVGEQLQVPSGLPKTLESALQRYGSATFKASAITVVDTTGKVSPALTYGKLLSRSKKIAYNLLNKIGQKRSSLGSNWDIPIKSGDRVALVFPNNDPMGFICAFYGCLTAGIVPVPVEVPITKRDSGSQQIGFLLGSCNINYALTSEACLKGLPKTPTGEIHTFKGWPKLNWLVSDNWPKPPKDWSPPPRISEDAVAYIEYSMDKEGSMKGVCVSRKAMISHCKALTGACSYTEGDIMVCLLDFKREVGLWHSVLTSILNGIHVIFIPYALMKVNPSCWLLMITKYKATTSVCKSRDLHWGLLATKDHKDINLSSLRMLLIADGANPWSLSSCDQFLSVFNSRGLRPDAVCPSASSTEAMTISIRRPGRTGIGATGRGVLSMSALSHGVIRVDQENSLTSLTLQDCGHILPNSNAAVVKMNGPPYRCKTDEVGEICISNFSTECFYKGLSGLSTHQFKMEILNSDNTVYGNQNQKWCKTKMLGFMGPGGLVFICGTRDGLMQVSGRKHNTDDIIATVLAVEPMKFVYRGRIAVFSNKVLRDERICVIAEQRPDCTEEESFQWMSRVLQAIDSIHQVGIYCLALVPPNYLPKTPLGGIHLPEVKRRYLEGTLHPANVLMCPHTCVTNLPKPRETHPEIGPASVMVGNIVQGNRLAVAQGRELGQANDDPAILLGDKDDFTMSKKCQYINEILKWRATTSPHHNLFTLLNSKGSESTTLTCSQLHKRAERIACLLMEKGKINTGDHVALVYPPGIDLICAFYGCLYVGAVPVTIRPPSATTLQSTLPTMKMIVDVSKSILILSNTLTIKTIKSKEATALIEQKNWVMILDTEDITKKKFTASYRAPTPEMIAYLDFSISTTGMLAGIKMSHSSATSLCKSMKLACELYPSRHIALCLDPYSGLGFILWCLSSVYSGHHSILIPPTEVELNPSLWLTTLSQYKVRDTFCSYGVMELCTKELGSSIQLLKSRGIDLTCVRTCVVVAEERPRVFLTNSFSKLFSSVGLSSRAVSTSFGCRVNVAFCLQGASSPDLTTVYVDMRALRNDRVTLVEKGAPHSLSLIESGKLLPGVRVIIANPDTKGHCGDCNLGEIWVQSPHNSSGYYTCFGDEQNNVHNNEHFNAKLTTGDTSVTYARTGYLGFLRRTQSIQADGELHDAIYVVGALDETIMLRGMRYHPIDIENSVLRCHKKISECAIFTWTNLLVVVAELSGNENEALDLVPLITNAVLEEHQVIVGVVVVVDPGVVPIDSRGEKQRMILRDGFLADKLDPIYVAYNM